MFDIVEWHEKVVADKSLEFKVEANETFGKSSIFAQIPEAVWLKNEEPEVKWISLEHDKEDIEHALQACVDYSVEEQLDEIQYDLDNRDQLEADYKDSLLSTKPADDMTMTTVEFVQLMNDNVKKYLDELKHRDDIDCIGMYPWKVECDTDAAMVDQNMLSVDITFNWPMYDPRTNLMMHVLKDRVQSDDVTMVTYDTEMSFDTNWLDKYEGLLQPKQETAEEIWTRLSKTTSAPCPSGMQKL